MRRFRRGGAAASVLMLVLFALACGRGGETERKGRVGLSEYSALLSGAPKKIQARVGDTISIPIEVHNLGRQNWSSTGRQPFYLSYHLLDSGRRLLKRDNPRFSFPEHITPAETSVVEARVKVPLEAGRYFLEFDVVHEGIAWFKDLGSRTLLVRLEAAARQWPEEQAEPGLDYSRSTQIRASQDVLNKLHQLIRITLDHGEITFKGRTGKVSGFAAGTAYPQIWLRDAATVLPAARFFYRDDLLVSWLKEHLACQASDGGLQDWIDNTGRTDKNTTETDQESSAVQAAYQVTKLKGTDWLKDKVEGRRIIDRLESGLEWVLAQRFDERHGLLKGAHTVDWGDVDIEDSDQRAIYVDDATQWTCDIYDQSMFYEAALELAEMLSSLGQNERALYWTVRAQSMKKNANAWLWQKDKGFYRVHLHLGALRHGFDEDSLFAMGGNAMAILSGLADEAQTRSIIDRALARQEEHGLSTVSGVLLPPYPRGTFKHPLVDDPFEYQNGGQWDWFGGRLVLAMFQYGYSPQAREKLFEIVAKDLANGGLFEWEDEDGLARGSDFYAGSAGSLARALYEGYLGVRITADSLSLEPRLGRDEADVHVHLAAADLFAAYQYRFRPDGALVFRFNSNFRGTGHVRVLIPWPVEGQDLTPLSLMGYEVRLDGREAPFSLYRINADTYLTVESDFKNHSLVIRRVR